MYSTRSTVGGGGGSGRLIRSNKVILLTISFIGILLFYLTGFLYFQALKGADSPGCRIVYMGPSYARIKSFDESHTKFASKYSLYLYREQNKDPIPDESNDAINSQLLNGIPILFIPGNAGSYRQVRSIASETSNLFFDQDVHGKIENPNAQNFDFFTADFNEDFTAFHGRTILDQAEYLNEAIAFILRLYENNVNRPKSVIILAHSMGGVVSRVMLTLPNYVPESINTIITLASPHAAVPLTFDGDILKIYSAIDRFWIAGFQNDSSNTSELSKVAKNRLKDLSLISITGGLLDTVLPADYTTLGYLVPPTNGFTVYTTGIPEVWTPIDHLAIVWCGQLRRKVSFLLLSIANEKSPHKTYDLSKRMMIMKSILLSGFEKYRESDLIAYNEMTNDKISIKFDIQQTSSIKTSSSEKLIKFRPGQKSENFNLIHIPANSEYKFSLLSSTPLNTWYNFQNEQNSKPCVLLCNNSQKTSKLSSSESDIFDYTTDKTLEYISVECIDVSQDSILVPKSNKKAKSLSDSSFGGDQLPFYSIQYGSEILSKYDLIIVGENNDGNDLTDEDLVDDDEFVIGELSEISKNEFVIESSLIELILKGGDISLSPNSKLLTNIRIKGAWSSILAYKVKIIYDKGVREESNKLDEEVTKLNFEPFIRQWSIEPFETKWHINAREYNNFKMNIHGIAPFTPFKIKNDSDSGINLELWQDSSIKGELPIEIIVGVDFISSLRLLVLRYRIGIVSMGLVVTLMVLLIQFVKFNQIGKWPNYVFGLSILVSPKILMSLSLFLPVLSLLVNIKWIATVLNFIDPVVLQDLNEINMSLNKDYKINSFFLGLEENSLVGIAILFLFMSIGINFVLYHIIIGIGQVISGVIKFIILKLNRSYKGKRIAKKVLVKNKWEWRKIIVSMILIMMIPIYLPYQFGYIISVFVQMISIIKLMIGERDGDNVEVELKSNTEMVVGEAGEEEEELEGEEFKHTKTTTRRKSYENVINYQLSILMMMLWILPINIPILIVFIHNFTISWQTPFLSHHNFLAIIPILIMVERNNTSNILPINNRKNFNSITYGFLVYFIMYGIIYGMRHTYWLHHLFNVFSCWLIILGWRE